MKLSLMNKFLQFQLILNSLETIGNKLMNTYLLSPLET